MPKSAQLSTTTGVAFTLPAGCVGYEVNNEEAVVIRIREDRNVSLTSDADKGRALQPGDNYSKAFKSRLSVPMAIHGIMASGTGYLTYEPHFK